MPRLTKIYTRKGDGGRTRLGDGAELSKAHLRIQAMGELDELSASLGVALSRTDDARVHEPLAAVQQALFDAGSDLCIVEGIEKIPRPGVDAARVSSLEQALDALNGQLPALNNFVLPGGHPVAAHIHLSRSICRRAERTVVALSEDEPVGEFVVPYLNRLSDFLFVLARAVNHWNQTEEVLWDAGEHQ